MDGKILDGKKGGTVYGRKKDKQNQSYHNKEIGIGKIRWWSGVDSTLKELTSNTNKTFGNWKG